MVVAHRISFATASLAMLAVAVASAQAVNPNNETAKRNLIQFIVTRNSSSIHPLWTGTAFPVTAGRGAEAHISANALQPGTAEPRSTQTTLVELLTAETHSTQAALTEAASAGSHSTQAALVEPGQLDIIKTTTPPTPALAASQNSPTTTQISTNSSGVKLAAEAYSAVPLLTTYPVMTNPSLSIGGPGTVTQATSASTKASTLVTPQSGSSATTVTPASSSQPPGPNGTAAQSSAITGHYALTVGPNGDVGLQSVSTTSAQAVTPASWLPSPLIGPAGTSSIPAGLGSAATSVGSNQSGGSRTLRPLPTGFSNGTLAGNRTPGNTSDVLPYLGIATRDRSQRLSWLVCMMSAALLAAL